MNPRQRALFRHVWQTTGCLVAAAKAARIPLRAALALHGKDSPPGPGDPQALRLQAPPATVQQDLEQAVTALESEAVRRALSGVQVPVFHQGRACGNTVKHSDQLLMFLLKTLKPERYAGAKETQPVLAARRVVLDIDLSSAEDEDLQDQE